MDPLPLALYFSALNLVAFASFGLDKQRARNGDRRIRERTLLVLAALGGTPGAYAGRRRFRHKTRKRSFSVSLHLIAMTQISLFCWILAAR